MIIKIGNFFFHYRNGLFPLAYALLFVPSRPLLNDYRIALAAGLVVALAGQSIRAVTVGLEYIIRGGRARQVYAERLVQGGIFAHCRNPLYVGNYLILLGVSLTSNSLLFFCIAIPFFTFAYWAIIAAEENFLHNKFGGEYEDYCRRVARFWPRFSGLGRTLSSMQFNWRRLITAEYGSAYIWMAAVILVQLKNLWLRGKYHDSRQLVIWLWSSFAVVTLAYLIARFLKKSRILQAARVSSP
jgi:protein-S-isoprenylcysteine O-methyltransferase Ste14